MSICDAVRAISHTGHMQTSCVSIEVVNQFVQLVISDP